MAILKLHNAASLSLPVQKKREKDQDRVVSGSKKQTLRNLRLEEELSTLEFSRQDVFVFGGSDRLTKLAELRPKQLNLRAIFCKL